MALTLAQKIPPPDEEGLRHCTGQSSRDYQVINHGPGIFTRVDHEYTAILLGIDRGSAKPSTLNGDGFARPG